MVVGAVVVFAVFWFDVVVLVVGVFLEVVGVVLVLVFVVVAKIVVAFWMLWLLRLLWVVI